MHPGPAVSSVQVNHWTCVESIDCSMQPHGSSQVELIEEGLQVWSNSHWSHGSISINISGNWIGPWGVLRFSMSKWKDNLLMLWRRLAIWESLWGVSLCHLIDILWKDARPALLASWVTFIMKCRKKGLTDHLNYSCMSKNYLHHRGRRKLY